MKCLIVGAGGVGGSIAAFLALAGNEVICIVRGAHKENMLAHGLKFHSDLKGEIILPCYQSGQLPSDAAMPYMQVCSTDEYMDTADVIFVCVKGYSVDSVAPCIRRAALPHTVVVPILNVYGSGPRIARACDRWLYLYCRFCQCAGRGDTDGAGLQADFRCPSVR